MKSKNKQAAPTLFGEDAPIEKTNKPKFDDYAGFVDKFKPKKTTDDCYTPPAIYEAVLEYVGTKYDLTGKQVVRPFYPNGDFERLDYPDNAVVIDNPPFSIVTKIARFYTTRNIPFFIFAPHLTLFSVNVDCSHIVVGASIIYDNGAVVNTSFLSNLFGDIKVLACSGLYLRFKQIQDAQKANLPKYVYPDNVLTVTQIDKFVKHGIPFEVKKSNVKHTSKLQAQKVVGKTIFGEGFLISDKAAAEKAAAEKAAAEKAAAERANVIVWTLSDSEREIIKKLNGE